MTDETARLFRLVGPAGLAVFRDAPGLEGRLTAGSAPVLRGEPTAGAQVFIASRGGSPMSTVTVTRSGTTAGIWSMATPPASQGQGVGRALLTGVLDAQRRAGVERFFLFATEAGRPLYQSIGFTTLAHCPAWVLG